MNRLLIPTVAALLPGCSENFAKNVCDDANVRAEFHEAVQKVLEVPICLHTVYPDEETRAIQESDKEAQDRLYKDVYIDGLNEELSGYNAYIDIQYADDANITVYESAPRDTIVNSDWALLNLYKSDQDMFAAAKKLAKEKNQTGCINWYILRNNEGTFESAAGDEAGFASLPSNSPKTNSIVTWGSSSVTQLHEFGHALGLLHTHEEEYAGSSIENPDEPYKYGDLLADTAPDPGVEHCEVPEALEGELKAICEQEYVKYETELPIDNVMSYYYLYPSGFSSEQIERMHCTWTNHAENIFKE